MNATPSVQLAALGDLSDYRVCAGDIDPRGWSVADSNGAILGTATDLIIDLDALVARYIVCTIERAQRRVVLIPTGFARLEPKTPSVHLDFVTVEDVERLPTFTGLPLPAGHGEQIEQALTGKSPAEPAAAKIIRRTT